MLRTLLHSSAAAMDIVINAMDTSVHKTQVCTYNTLVGVNWAAVRSRHFSDFTSRFHLSHRAELEQHSSSVGTPYSIKIPSAFYPQFQNCLKFAQSSTPGSSCSLRLSTANDPCRITILLLGWQDKKLSLIKLGSCGVEIKVEHLRLALGYLQALSLSPHHYLLSTSPASWVQRHVKLLKLKRTNSRINSFCESSLWRTLSALCVWRNDCCSPATTPFWNPLNLESRRQSRNISQLVPVSHPYCRV